MFYVQYGIKNSQGKAKRTLADSSLRHVAQKTKLLYKQEFKCPQSLHEHKKDFKKPNPKEIIKIKKTESVTTWVSEAFSKENMDNIHT